MYTADWVLCSDVGIRAALRKTSGEDLSLDSGGVCIGWDVLSFDYEYDSKVELHNPFKNMEVSTSNSAVLAHDYSNGPVFGMVRSTISSFNRSAGTTLGDAYRNAYRFYLTPDESREYYSHDVNGIYAIEGKRMILTLGAESTYAMNYTNYQYSFDPSYLQALLTFGFEANGGIEYSNTMMPYVVKSKCDAAVVYAIGILNGNYVGAKLIVTPN